MNKNRDSYIYRCFSGDDLLYVGISINPLRRLKEHEYRAEWFGIMDRWTCDLVGSRKDALLTEAQAIRSEKPRNNHRHSGVAT